MNVLFVSKLTGNLWTGPNNSVPAQVLAQSKIDNVMWVNLNHICLPQWKRCEYRFINYDDFPNCSLEDLPIPFNKPDFVIFEEIYCYSPFDKMVLSTIKSGCPFSIVPRSSLTVEAQHQHYFKKKIANILFYNKFINKSSFIQYLTRTEQEESRKSGFAHNGIIIPNGTYMPDIESKEFCKNGIKGIYIGRIEIRQKGLDLLVNAVASIKDILRSANFTIKLYGPNIENSVELLNKIITVNQISDIVELNNSIFDDDKSQVLKSADVFIQTSRFEGLPMGLIEALSYGIPCIATGGTYLMDEIISYDAGWAAGSTVESISNALIKMISEKELLKTKSLNSRTLATHYSWDNLANILHDHITDTI